MLERVALHQARLKTPGLALDPSGVALGTQGLVLVPSVDRLVAWLAIWARDRSLVDLAPTLAIEQLRSRLGTREISVRFAAESCDRMDRAAEIARTVGGHTFTGTSRHFVQYRDAAAPFGYDVSEPLASDAAALLHHTKFSQAYDVERAIDLRALILRLLPELDASRAEPRGELLVVAEAGLGPALVGYLVRSAVEAEVGVAEWPPESAFDDGPVRRYLVRIPSLPKRMRGLVMGTPGLVPFAMETAGVGVELGHRHPIAPRAWPELGGLVLFRGRGNVAWTIDRAPAFGDVRSLGKVEVRVEGARATVADHAKIKELRVPVRVVASTAAWREVTATWIAEKDLPIVKRLAYALPRSMLTRATIAMTSHGAFVRSHAGSAAIPLGVPFVEVHPRVFVAAGSEIAPAIAPDVLARALGAPESTTVFLTADGRAIAVDDAAFSRLEDALVSGPSIELMDAQAIEKSLEDAAIDLDLVPLGAFPLAGVDLEKG